MPRFPGGPNVPLPFDDVDDDDLVRQATGGKIPFWPAVILVPTVDDQRAIATLYERVASRTGLEAPQVFCHTGLQVKGGQRGVFYRRVEQVPKNIAIQVGLAVEDDD